MRASHAFAVALLLGSSACKSAPKELAGSKPAATVSDAGALQALTGAATDAAMPASSVSFVGVVRGVVKLKQGAELPLSPPPLMAGGLSPANVEGCPPAGLADRQTVQRSADSGGLSPVHLAVTHMSEAPKRPPITHELFIDGCRLRPSLIGGLRGDTIRLTNRSSTAFLPVLPGDAYMQGIMPRESREFVMNHKGSVQIQCSFGTYCGATVLVSVSHPLYAVTDGRGEFVIERVPLDQELKLHAWHPLFKVTTTSFKLTADQREATLELLLEPTPPPAALGKPPATARPRAAKPVVPGEPASVPERPASKPQR